MHPFQKRFQANLAAGLDRPEAMRQARQDDPEGYQSWLNEYNAEHGQETMPERLSSRRAPQ